MTITRSPAPETPIFARAVADQLLPIMMRAIRSHPWPIIEIQDRITRDDLDDDALADLDLIARSMIDLAPITAMIELSESDLDFLIEFCEEWIMEY